MLTAVCTPFPFSCSPNATLESQTDCHCPTQSPSTVKRITEPNPVLPILQSHHPQPLLSPALLSSSSGTPLSMEKTPLASVFFCLCPPGHLSCPLPGPYPRPALCPSSTHGCPHLNVSQIKLKTQFFSCTSHLSSAQ